MAANKFTSVPPEILQRFALFLPPKDVLNLALTCRKTHNACDNLAIWRQIVCLNSGFRAEVCPSEESSRRGWKQLAVVDAKASSDYQNDSLSWLPQAMALHHQVYTTADLDWLVQISDPSHYQPNQRAFDCELPNIDDRPMRSHPHHVESSIDADGWRLTQVGSFCFAVHQLYHGPLDKDQPTVVPCPNKFSLETAPWTLIEAVDATSQPAKYSKLVVILHTLANRVVGIFGTQLSKHLAHERAVTGWIPNGTSQPPYRPQFRFHHL